MRPLAISLCIINMLAPALAAPPIRKLDPGIAGFTPENRARLDALLVARGRASASWDAQHPPVATFDWDNTMMRNDIGDATMAWLLRHDGILQPPERDWSRTSAALTALARRALAAACDATAEPGRPLPTGRAAACADEIFAIYSDGKTRAHDAAWTREITLTTNEPYAWLARLLAGRTADEARAFARAAYREAAAAPVGAVQTVGSRKDVVAWVRIYEPMKDLVAALSADGFDVWIVSASPQPLSEIVAAEIGVPAERVIGVRTDAVDGRYGYDLQGCGGAPANSVITFNRGKRCWINKVIFGVPERDQLSRGARRQVLAGGDSDTDVSFVQDASDLKLVIDRNKMQLMCNAWANAGGRWIVQPMFIQPLPRRTEPYPCSTAVDAEGKPIVDEEGHALPDQLPKH
jgi:hypothetical protein